MARRSLTGKGLICGIYTLGVRDPRERERGALSSRDDPILTASIGEDFADCRWPVTVKVQASVDRDRLLWYLGKLTEAIEKGFLMDPSIGPAIYWEWTGTVLPGIGPSEDDQPSAQAPGRTMGQTAGTGERSVAGRGARCGIYLMDTAEQWAGDEFYGEIRGEVAISGSVDEDYAASHWPVILKVHEGVTREDLCRYLRALAACVDDGLFFPVTEPLH